ncbi:MAG: YkgJ family cysteine cluster protein [Planctomycetota bacterium]
MNWFLIKAVIKARKNGLLHLVPAKDPTNFQCLKDRCHKCCSNLGSPVVTPDKAEKINPDSIQKDKNAMFLKSRDSSCCLLKDGLCSIYENRPRGCREYPWYNIDGQLYCDAGCPGIKHDTDDRPNIEDIQPFENFFPNTPKILICLIKKICTKK